MATNDDGHLADPEIWMNAMPRDVFAGFRNWASAHAITIKHVRRLTAGRSGSYVAVVRIRPARGTVHHAVLKILPPEIGQAESRGVELARQYTSPDFWERHMVPTTERATLPMTDWWIHILKLAHADRPLADLVDDPDFADCCGVIIETLVDQWHFGHDPDSVFHTPSSFLASFLNDGHMNGIAAFCRDAGIEYDRPPDVIEVPARVDTLLNPLALLKGMSKDPAAGNEIGDPIEIYLGNGHGDLQLFNVLVPTAAPLRPEDFKLIDYGRFSPETPVGRDPVKLVLAASAAWLPALQAGSAVRSSLAELVVDPTNHLTSAPIAGYLAVSKRVYDAASRWGLTRDMPDVWERQRLLVLIGSALRAVADGELTLPDRWWFFEVAALAARAYGEFGKNDGRHRPHPTTPPSLVRRREPARSHGRAGELVQPSYQPSTSARSTSGPMHRPGTVKLAFVHRLANDWPELADALDVPAHTQRRFEQFNAARELWEWLEVRERLHELPAALRYIGRTDLADVLDDGVA
jgi:hypothetical protein